MPQPIRIRSGAMVITTSAIRGGGLILENENRLLKNVAAICPMLETEIVRYAYKYGRDDVRMELMVWTQKKH